MENTIQGTFLRIRDVVIVMAMILSIAVVVYLKERPAITAMNNGVSSPPPVQAAYTESAEGEGEGKEVDHLPALYDFGSDKCIPCKMMMPVLESLKKEYAGKMKVVFVDIWKDPKKGRENKIQMIPCQIFYDASGKELYRHEGFYDTSDIMKKWAELGIHFPTPPLEGEGALIRDLSSVEGEKAEGEG